jgi:hypothetical protein
VFAGVERELIVGEGIGCSLDFVDLDQRNLEQVYVDRAVGRVAVAGHRSMLIEVSHKYLVVHYQYRNFQLHQFD